MKCPKPRIFLEILGHFPEISRFSGMIVFEKKTHNGAELPKIALYVYEIPFLQSSTPTAVIK